jgi:hypothetical protein
MNKEDGDTLASSFSGRTIACHAIDAGSIPAEAANGT